MDERPSGWYDDPDEPTRLRYWDGDAWTERTHRKAPMPPPQPPRAPVARLRPSREERDRAVQETEGRGSAAASARREQAPLDADSSPRPWATHDAAGARHRRADQGGTAPGEHGARRAGFGLRALASIIDFVIATVIFWLLFALAAPFLGDALGLIKGYVDSVQRAVEASAAGQVVTPPQPSTQVMVVMITLTYFYAGVLVLHELLLLKRFGVTAGRLLTRIRVVPTDGAGRATAGMLLRRTLVKYLMFVLSGLPLLSYAAFAFNVVDWLSPLFDHRRRALHDKWSGTEVVRR